MRIRPYQRRVVRLACTGHHPTITFRDLMEESMSKRRALGVLAAAATGAVVLLAPTAFTAGAQTAAQAAPAHGVYEITGARSRADFDAIARSGADIITHDHPAKQTAQQSIANN